MSCSLCDDGNIEVFILDEETKIVSYNSWVRKGCPPYKDCYVERCSKCFPEFVDRHNLLLKQLQSALNSKDQMMINICKAEIKKNWEGK